MEISPLPVCNCLGVAGGGAECSEQFHNILVIFLPFFPDICFCLLSETGHSTRQAFGLILLVIKLIVLHYEK